MQSFFSRCALPFIFGEPSPRRQVGNRAFTRFPCAVLGCLFLSSFDNVPACLPPHISEPHLFFMQQTVYERLSRASGPSPARQPHPRRAASNALAFHLPLLPSAVRWQQRRASPSERPLLAPFVPKSRAKPRAFSIEMLRVRN